jgi:hypothetical protein
MVVSIVWWELIGRNDGVDFNGGPRMGVQESGEFTWRVSDCEELSGGSHWRRKKKY